MRSHLIIVPRGTSFHCSVELALPPIEFDSAWFSCCCGLFPSPSEVGAVNQMRCMITANRRAKRPELSDLRNVEHRKSLFVWRKKERDGNPYRRTFMTNHSAPSWATNPKWKPASVSTNS
jgi:hypothetical protein